MNKIIKRSISLYFLCGLLFAGTPPINLFNPYDILLFQPLIKLPEFQMCVGYERLFNACGMQADDDEKCKEWRKCVNVLQLYQDEQDALAALKGTESTTLQGELGLLFPRDDDNGTQGSLKPCGTIRADNFMFTARYAWCNGVTFGLYLPVIRAELKDVCWKNTSTDSAFEALMSQDLIAQLEEAGNIRLRGWQRHGLGDLAALFTWDRYYPQNKLWLKNVHGGLRGGLLFPTGEKKDENQLFAFAFGNDGGLGILGGATLELWFWRFLRFGIDGEFTQIFGSCKARRIKTDPAQTDFLFLIKVPTDKEIGFQQHYTLWLDAARFWCGLSARIAYQYTKHNEDQLFLATDHYDEVLANTAESLQEWTMHNLIVSAKFESYLLAPGRTYLPEIMVFYKHGFNGKRSVLGDSIGAQITFNF